MVVRDVFLAHTHKLTFAEGYQVRLDNNFQYGQKNAEGELRFIVYHDQERKPYQV